MIAEQCRGVRGEKGGEKARLFVLQKRRGKEWRYQGLNVNGRKDTESRVRCRKGIDTRFYLRKLCYNPHSNLGPEKTKPNVPNPGSQFILFLKQDRRSPSLRQFLLTRILTTNHDAAAEVERPPTFLVYAVGPPQLSQTPCPCCRSVGVFGAYRESV